MIEQSTDCLPDVPSSWYSVGCRTNGETSHLVLLSSLPLLGLVPRQVSSGAAVLLSKLVALDVT